MGQVTLLFGELKTWHYQFAMRLLRLSDSAAIHDPTAAPDRTVPTSSSTHPHQGNSSLPYPALQHDGRADVVKDVTSNKIGGRLYYIGLSGHPIPGQQDSVALNGHTD